MAILQKLETSYLAILRFVVILISGLLLVATLILSATALINFQGDATPGQHIQNDMPDQIIDEHVKLGKSGEPSANSAAKAAQSPVDPNQAEYKRAVNLIVPFVQKYGRGEEISEENIIKYMDERAKSQPTPELAKAFASGLPKTLEKVLSDKKIIELVSRPTWYAPEPGNNIPQMDATVGQSSIWVVVTTINRYFEEFNRQAEQAIVEQATRKERATQSLYIAAATFGAFLLLALLSIIVRVERNLRPLAHLADKPLASE